VRFVYRIIEGERQGGSENSSDQDLIGMRVLDKLDIAATTLRRGTLRDSTKIQPLGVKILRILNAPGTQARIWARRGIVQRAHKYWIAN
jgi:hypothetical protein